MKAGVEPAFFVYKFIFSSCSRHTNNKALRGGFKMTYQERRIRDCEKMKKVEKYMDEIYKKNGISFNRIVDDTLQKRGIDLIASYNDKNYPLLIDEKCAVHYYNKNLKTFCFEVAAKNNYNNLGWLISPFSLTTHYCLIWIRATKEDLSDIYELEWMIIDKHKIRDYIEKKGITDFKRIVSFVRKNGSFNKNGNIEYKIDNDIKIVWSRKIKPEQPVNVVISRNMLKKISEHSGFVKF